MPGVLKCAAKPPSVPAFPLSPPKKRHFARAGVRLLLCICEFGTVPIDASGGKEETPKSKPFHKRAGR